MSGPTAATTTWFGCVIQTELERRLSAAREADPTKRHDEALRRDLVRIRKGIDRLLTAYQEGLLPIEELRERMPELRRREKASNAELQAITDQSVTRAAYLRLAETLNTFLTRLRSSAGALDISERQRAAMRLLVKEVLVGDDKIIIRHCIPLPNRSDDGPLDGAGGRSEGKPPSPRLLLSRFPELIRGGIGSDPFADGRTHKRQHRPDSEECFLPAHCRPPARRPHAGTVRARVEPATSIRPRERYDVGGTSSRALRQHRKLAAKQGMSRVSNRDMGHHPIEDCGALQCTVTPR